MAGIPRDAKDFIDSAFAHNNAHVNVRPLINPFEGCGSSLIADMNEIVWLQSKDNSTDHDVATQLPLAQGSMHPPSTLSRPDNLLFSLSFNQPAPRMRDTKAICS
jgi:hypothetical protein